MKYLKYLGISVLTFVLGIVSVNAETITLPGLIEGKTADTNGIYTLDNGTQLIYDNGPQNNLRFVGENPNNWVSFGGESPRWRIIGLMNGIDDGTGKTESRLKLIQTEQIGKYSWRTSDYNVNDGNGINDWTGADLMKLLNPGYENNVDNICFSDSDCETGNYMQTTVNNSLWWNASAGGCYIYNSRKAAGCNFTSNGLPEAAKDMIGDAVWYLNGQTQASWSDIPNRYTPAMFYLKERGMAGPPYVAVEGQARTWTGKVAVMYPSDFGYATAGGSNMSRTQCYSLGINWDKNGESADCVYNNWLWNSSHETWTLTQAINDYGVINNVFYIPNGSMSYTNATYARNVKPVVYLKSTVQITGGSGTESDPYTLTNVVKYNVTTSSDSNGSITASAEVDENDDFEVEFTPNTGYEIDKVLVNSVDVTNDVTNNKLTIENITADTTVSVTYKMIRFDVTTTSGDNGTITGGATVNYNADYTITLTPNEGYEIDTVSVNGVDVKSSVTDNKLVLQNILEDKVVKVTYKNSTYKFISGMDQEFDDDDLVFKTDGPLGIVGKVYVNDEELDSSNYTLKSGSTIITILKDYLATLSDATYNLKITYTNGSEATTTFVVKAKDTAAANTTPATNTTTNTQTTNTSSNPNTADTIMISVIIGLISVLGLAGVVVFLRKNSIKE